MYRFRTSLLAVSLLVLITQMGCKKSNELKSYLAYDETTFSVVTLADKDQFINETMLSNKLYKKHIRLISKIGVITNDSEDYKIISKQLDVDTLPTYLLFDSKGAILIEQDFDEFESKISGIMQGHLEGVQ